MTIPDICSEILLNWKSVQTYLSRIAPSQENQEVRNRPERLEWAIIGDDFFPVKLELFGGIIRDCSYFSSPLHSL